ncbi:hypothetical protein M409DRAFT_53728 [Zasmidium cellare ATCC 36951]|uniref:Uncharacterized protein n=1 Tax=Zasmidium cellare ATCC 36951 TaxID=1080233 RepID=A0A6A6CKI5_ZASCE|nr:uncharacterized protein M409DRAFT_53728 [Zasmidium cellare ATCC 36951]KAF2167757.1 hypothetical protein M409DRAFT_53728 [Zasmidium cellare ATCC 36951]
MPVPVEKDEQLFVMPLKYVFKGEQASQYRHRSNDILSLANTTQKAPGTSLNHDLEANNYLQTNKTDPITTTSENIDTTTTDAPPRGTIIDYTLPTHLILIAFTLPILAPPILALQKSCGDEWSLWEALSVMYTTYWTLFLTTEVARVSFKSDLVRVVSLGTTIAVACGFAGGMVLVARKHGLPWCEG